MGIFCSPSTYRKLEESCYFRVKRQSPIPYHVYFWHWWLHDARQTPETNITEHLQESSPVGTGDNQAAIPSQAAPSATMVGSDPQYSWKTILGWPATPCLWLKGIMVFRSRSGCGENWGQGRAFCWVVALTETQGSSIQSLQPWLVAPERDQELPAAWCLFMWVYIPARPSTLHAARCAAKVSLPSCGFTPWGGPGMEHGQPAVGLGKTALSSGATPPVTHQWDSSWPLLPTLASVHQGNSFYLINYHVFSFILSGS